MGWVWGPKCFLGPESQGPKSCGGIFVRSQKQWPFIPQMFIGTVPDNGAIKMSTRDGGI